MLKTDERIYNGLIDIFDCEIIGSYKLVKENLLDLEDINDIDIYIKDEKVFKNIMRYLKNNGYIQKKVIMNSGGYNKFFKEYIYLIFQKKDYFDIHLIPFEKGYKFSKEEILSQKIRRFDKRDKKHLKKIIERLESNEIEEDRPIFEGEYYAK